MFACSLLFLYLLVASISMGVWRGGDDCRPVAVPAPPLM